MTVFLGCDHFGLLSILGRGTAQSSLSQAPSRERLLSGSCESDLLLRGHLGEKCNLPKFSPLRTLEIFLQWTVLLETFSASILPGSHLALSLVIPSQLLPEDLAHWRISAPASPLPSLRDGGTLLG